jgi:hypothetical protein
MNASLLDYCDTDRQREMLNAYLEHGGHTQAARALGVNVRTIQRAISNLELKAARKGFSPAHDMTRTVPEGFQVKGVSTYYNADGKPTGQWVKSKIDDELQEEFRRAAMEAMGAELPRLPSLVLSNLAPLNTDLCNVYTLTDSHVGMLAWHKEGGADWDLKIAENTLVECFERLVRASPDAATCVVAQLGDFLHYDSLSPVTPTSHHVLDADGRFSKMVKVAILILRKVIDQALHKHEKVIVLMAEGNHDMTSSVWLRYMFKALYENEPRVEMIDSDLPYYTYRHGSTMLAWHHGHLKKIDTLPLLFAAQYPEVWGLTKKRYCHVGHRHHVEEKEHNGMTVIQHPTLAARDAYSARHGWLSDRQITSITYSSVHGQIARNTVTPEMIAS